MYGKVVDKMVEVVTQLFSGEMVDIVGPVNVVPDWDDHHQQDQNRVRKWRAPVYHPRRG